jgi:hypothetical protein
VLLKEAPPQSDSYPLRKTTGGFVVRGTAVPTGMS